MQKIGLLQLNSIDISELLLPGYLLIVMLHWCMVCLSCVMEATFQQMYRAMPTSAASPLAGKY